MNKLPWGHRPDIIGIAESTISNEEKARLIYKKCKEYESMANDSFSKMVPYDEKDILEFLEENNG